MPYIPKLVRELREELNDCGGKYGLELNELQVGEENHPLEAYHFDVDQQGGGIWLNRLIEVAGKHIPDIGVVFVLVVIIPDRLLELQEKYFERLEDLGINSMVTQGESAREFAAQEYLTLNKTRKLALALGQQAKECTITLTIKAVTRG